MQDFSFLNDVSCVLPQKHSGKTHSRIIYRNKEERTLPVRPETVLLWIARKNYIDLSVSKRRSEAYNFQTRGVPLPLGIHDAFLPFHLVDEPEEGHICYGFCNVANQRVEVVRVPNESRRSLLRLENGIEILTPSTPVKLSSYVSMAIATHQHFLHDIFSGGGPIFFPPTHPGHGA